MLVYGEFCILSLYASKVLEIQSGQIDHDSLNLFNVL